jgi:GABA(A) receptor-associated protein
MINYDELKRIRAKYPNKIPVLCKRAKYTDPKLDKIKYLAPFDLTIGQFAQVIRRRLKLSSGQAIFILCNDSYPSTSTEIKDLYNPDTGFLLIIYQLENVFG